MMQNMMQRPIKLTTILPAALNNIRAGATFLSIKEYEDNYSGLYNFGIVFHVDYIKAVKRSLDIILGYQPQNDLERKARLDLIQSFQDTLSGNNPRAYSAKAYCPITDGKQLIKGVKWHDRGKAVHLYGFLVHRVELRPSAYSEDNRYLYTKIRKALKAKTPVDRFRQFKLVEGKFSRITVERLSFYHQDLIRQI